MQKRTNVARQSALGKLIGKQGEVHCSIPRVQKGDMTVKDHEELQLKHNAFHCIF